MKVRIPPVTVLGVILAGMLPAARPPQQVKTPPVREDVRRQAGVTLKLLEVYVTDDKGAPVLDLQASDFRVFDEGRPQTISAFERHLRGPAVAVSGAAAAPAGRDVRALLDRKLVFFFDLNSNSFEGMRAARNAALSFLETQVQPGDQVAVLSFQFIRGLTLHEYFTSDHDRVRAAVRSFRGVPGRDTQGFSTLGGEALGMEAMNQKDVAVARAPTGPGVGSRFTNAMKNLAQALAHVPGRKSLVFFSLGYGEAVVRPVVGDDFRDMGRALSTAGVPVLTVDTTAGEPRFYRDPLPETSLAALARMTGGAYLGGVDSPENVARRIQNATGDYYVLGYTIQATTDGRFHPVRVEVIRPGRRVRAQEGYYNPRPFVELSPVEKHLQLVDLAFGDRGYFGDHLDVPAAAVPFSGSGAGGAAALLAEIPVVTIRQAVGDRTEVFMTAFDAERTAVSTERAEVDWSKVPGDAAVLYSIAELPPGRYDIRIILRNTETGMGAVGACEVEVSAPAEAAFALDPPFLLREGRSPAFIHIERAKTGADGSRSGTTERGAAPSSPDLAGLFPFPLEEYRPLAGEVEKGMTSVDALLRSRRSGTDLPPLWFSARWISEPDGAAADANVEVAGTMNREGMELYLLRIAKPDLAPGRYTLSIEAEDPASDSTREVRSSTVAVR